MSESSEPEASDSQPVEIRDDDEGHADDSVLADSSGLSGEGTLTAHPGGILITAHLWFTWLQIAIERASEARRIRAEMVRSQREGQPIIDFLAPEFEASVVAIAASAHALDALYGSQVIPADARNHGQNRPSKIREALKRTFKTGPVNTPWASQFTQLFDLRDAAVHAEEKPTVPELHPVVGYTARQHAMYSLEEADRTVDFALSVFRWCIDHPRSTAAAWAADVRPLVEQLEQRWSGSTS